MGASERPGTGLQPAAHGGRVVTVPTAARALQRGLLVREVNAIDVQHNGAAARALNGAPGRT